MSHPPRTVATWLANAPSSRAPTAARTPSNGRGSARGAASGTRWSKRPSRCEGRRGRRRSRAAVADHAGRPDAMEAPADGRQRARPCVGRRARRRLGHARRRRAGRWQVHIAACRPRPRSHAAVRGVSTCRERSRPRRCRAARQAVDALVDGLWSRPRATSRASSRSIDSVDPDFVVVDSVQTMHDSELGTTPGAVNQVRGCAQQLIEGEAKARGTAMMLVGHVTKEDDDRRPAVCSSTPSTPCSRSAATGTTCCGSCGPSSTASARPTSSACSRWASRD